MSDIDPDLVPAVPHPGLVLAVISVGGLIGAEGRYALGRLITHGATGFPFSTLIINASGAFALGVLMAIIALRTVPPLVRPFVGVGVLGGYTTFSTFAVDSVGLAHRQHLPLGIAYVVSTVALCALAVWAGDRLTRAGLGDGVTALLVALGAAVGAPLRYLMDRFISARHRSPMPWGTFGVNMVASFVLGLLVGVGASADTAALLGVGFCGTLSTYSTFSFETMRLASTGRGGWAALNVGLSLVVGFAAASAGWAIGAQ